MKKLLVVIFVLFFCNISYAQTFGASIGVLDESNTDSKGIGVNLEYLKYNTDNSDWITMASFLHNNHRDHSLGDMNRFQFAVTFGYRYYLAKSTISPYISLEGGASYFYNEGGGTFFIDPNSLPKGTERRKVITKGVYPGIGSSVGTYVKLSDNLKVNLNARIYLPTENLAQFLAFNGGVIFDM